MRLWILLVVIAASAAWCVAPAAAHQTPPDDGQHVSAESPESPHDSADQPDDADQEHPGGHEAGPAHEEHADAEHAHHPVPHLFWVWTFVAMLLSIAILPLVPAAHHWWEKNTSKLIVALILGFITLLYYQFRGYGFHAEPGFASVRTVLDHAVIEDYIPFIVLLFSLFTISGGINLRGDVPAHPRTNTLIIGIGGVLASFIGTTGASMLLIRPILQINSERRRVVHTVVFFIFVVANCGGLLLPIGDPPLFLGYLRGVPFLWTLHLVVEWGFCIGILLIVYFVLDSLAWRHEEAKDIKLDEAVRQPIELRGKRNILLLLGVVLAVGLLVPGKKFVGTEWTVPVSLPLIGRLLSLREIAMFLLAGLSMIITPRVVRQDNKFDFYAIKEVACLFIGIFITMQVPIEILNVKGPTLGIDSAMKFFWCTGSLSSFLDNAPTYVVFFETAKTLVNGPGPGVMTLPHDVFINVRHLAAISCGAVFMGANTYIGNGPNFMVKAIAEQSGVRMPSFFGYMVYSIIIFIPILVLISLVFMR